MKDPVAKFRRISKTIRDSRQTFEMTRRALCPSLLIPRALRTIDDESSSRPRYSINRTTIERAVRTVRHNCEIRWVAQTIWLPRFARVMSEGRLAGKKASWEENRLLEGPSPLLIKQILIPLSCGTIIFTRFADTIELAASTREGKSE